MSYGAYAYKSANNKMSSSIDIVIDLYDESVQKFKEARSAIESGDVEKRYQATERVRKILNGLATAMYREDEALGEMINTLETFYAIMGRLIIDINSHNDLEACDKAISYMSEMAATWRQVRAQVLSIEQQTATTPVSTKHMGTSMSI